MSNNVESSILTEACMAPPGISDKMVKSLLKHPKIEIGYAEFESAVLNHNVNAANKLRDAKKYELSQKDKNNLLLKLIKENG